MAAVIRLLASAISDAREGEDGKQVTAPAKVGTLVEPQDR
jgi:hypothetical protein